MTNWGLGVAKGDVDPPDIVERTFHLGRRVDNLCRYLREHRVIPSHRINQLERAGSAVGALVEEAQGGESRKDFLHKMSVALKEARETFYWLRQLLVSNVMPAARLEALTDEARQIKLILAAIVNSTRENTGEEPEPGEEPTDLDDVTDADQ